MGNLLSPVIYFVLCGITYSLSNDITTAVGISVVGTIVVCFIIAVLTWKCCLSSANAKKHQFEIGNDLTNNVITNNYVYTSENGVRDTICTKCRQQFSTVPENEYMQKNLAEECPVLNPKNVEVVVHNNSRAMEEEEEIQKPMTDDNEEFTLADPGTSPTASIPRDILQFVVHLKKTPTGSLGLSIVGGRNSKLGDIGIFIKSAIENSPAYLCGQIKPWDQILKVNDTLMEDLTIQEALTTLKSQPSDVFLSILPAEIATAKLEQRLKSNREPESPSYHESLLSKNCKRDLLATDGTTDGITQEIENIETVELDSNTQLPSSNTQLTSSNTQLPSSNTHLQNKSLYKLRESASFPKDTDMDISAADTERYVSEDDSVSAEHGMLVEEHGMLVEEIPTSAPSEHICRILAQEVPTVATHVPFVVQGSSDCITHNCTSGDETENRTPRGDKFGMEDKEGEIQVSQNFSDEKFQRYDKSCDLVATVVVNNVFETDIESQHLCGNNIISNSDIAVVIENGI